jgi:hypothetical protein
MFRVQVTSEKIRPRAEKPQTRTSTESGERRSQRSERRGGAGPSKLSKSGVWALPVSLIDSLSVLLSSFESNRVIISVPTRFICQHDHVFVEL